MYTAIMAPGGFGALPALLVTAVLTMVKSEYTEAQIRNQLAEQYQELKLMSEAQLTETAVLLGRRTATPEWEWFNLLRSARDMALFQNGGTGNGVPGNGAQQQSSMTTWIGLGAVALVLVVIMTRR